MRTGGPEERNSALIRLLPDMAIVGVSHIIFSVPLGFRLPPPCSSSQLYKLTRPFSSRLSSWRQLPAASGLKQHDVRHKWLHRRSSDQSQRVPRVYIRQRVYTIVSMCGSLNHAKQRCRVACTGKCCRAPPRCCAEALAGRPVLHQPLYAKCQSERRHLCLFVRVQRAHGGQR